MSLAGKYSYSYHTDDFETRDSSSSSFDGINFGASRIKGNISSIPTEIFRCIKKREWASVVKKCHDASSSEADTWIAERNVDGSIKWKLLPLHQACESKAPSEVVKALIKAYPDGVSMKDSGGDLPLHLACREKASKAVVFALLKADPHAAKVEDDEGRLPLHLACRRGAGAEIIDNLIIAYHGAAQSPDSYSLLPLHWACAQNAPVPVVERLLRAYPQAVDMKDKWGRTPKSLAQASTNSEKDNVLRALERDPSYWTVGLVETIDTLKYKFNKNANIGKQSQHRATSLEGKLAEVSQISSSAAQTFRSLKDELEDENIMLREKLRKMTDSNSRNDQLRQELEGENSRMKRDLKQMTTTLNEVSNVFRGMEEQRAQLAKVTGSMENHLQKASFVAHDEI